jgi:hypothetical protein
MLRTTGAACAALVLLAAGCSSKPAEAIHAANRKPADPAVTAIRAQAATVSVRRGGADPRPVPWDGAALVPGGRELLVHFVGGDGRCAWLDHVAVEETAVTVTITVHVARDPKAAPGCTPSAKGALARATLLEPLRGRTVYDGADRTAKPVVRAAS